MTANQQQVFTIRRIANRLHVAPDVIGMIWVSSGHAKKWRVLHE
jgi:hypothetical protein